ncbi:hypothetical protein [Lysobacter enzymogenes]|uniref:hypothetical protein n=1 Tax=Lysobacter enzymogenes TaxID=69 RepID=UPI001A97591C|nr:hypothetical protein [Lysobacter enzymogenes]QQP95413.1 hypothetical protein JHW38_19550 [Lysobacter enzymogenes]
MSASKRITATIVLLLAFQAWAPAQAASLQIWNGFAWTDTGYVRFRGPVQFSYVRWTLPCDMVVSVTVLNGTPSVTGASFSGSTGCASTAAQALSWPIAIWPSPGSTVPVVGAPTPNPPVYTLELLDVRFAVGAPLNVFCPSATGTHDITAYLDSTNFVGSNNKLVFDSALGPCRLRTQTFSALEADVPLRVI